ncbi:double-strand recombination repair protein [Enterococcus phage 9181]|nr:double-strand recombination repair protein [Enterococcus phage 9181]
MIKITTTIADELSSLMNDLDEIRIDRKEITSTNDKLRRQIEDNEEELLTLRCEEQYKIERVIEIEKGLGIKHG